MDNLLKIADKLPFLSYFGKRAKVIILSLLLISLITLIIMTFQAYRDSERVVYLKDVVLILLLVGTLAFVQYYFFQNMIKPIKSLHKNLTGLKSEEGKLETVKEAEGEQGIGHLIERINFTISSFDDAMRKLVKDKEDLEITLNMIGYERRKLQSVLDCLPETLMVTNTTGDLLFINSAAERLFRLSRRDVIGKPLKDFVSEYEVLSAFVEKNSFLEGGAAVAQELNIKQDGRQNSKVFKAIYNQVKNENDKALGYALILIDNTQQKITDQERSDFVSGVAHELRTPLTTIKAKVEMILDGDVEEHDTQIEFLNGIIEEVDRLSALINNLLNISRIELGSTTANKSSVKIKKLLEESFSMIEQQAVKKGVNLNKNVPERLSASVVLDKQMIQMAINNIVGNAIKYTPSGGSIFIEGEEKEKDVIIHIKDTGIGIPEDDLPRIFEKFYRSNQKEVKDCPGNGLGLSVVQQIIDMHGGEITVTSEVGEGSDFIISLPKERGTNV